MDLIIRNAMLRDATGMAQVLNEIIEVGGTTARLDPMTDEIIQESMLKDVGQTSWLVALDSTHKIIGYQSAEPHSKLPKDAANIASFVKVGIVGGGVGTKLFTQTTTVLRDLGYTWINASIRSDNVSGLRYYDKMGFKDWKIEPDACLSDGRMTGKHHKRYDL